MRVGRTELPQQQRTHFPMLLLFRLEMSQACVWTGVTVPSWQALCKVAAGMLSIRLAGCYNVGSIALGALGKGCPKLTDINLAMCPRVNAPALASLTSGCTSLTTLCLRGCDHVDDEALMAIGRHGGRLTSINLSDLELVTDRGVASLVRGCRGLRTINLCSTCSWLVIGSMRVFGKLFRHQYSRGFTSHWFSSSPPSPPPPHTHKPARSNKCWCACYFLPTPPHPRLTSLYHVWFPPIPHSPPPACSFALLLQTPRVYRTCPCSPSRRPR